MKQMSKLLLVVVLVVLVSETKPLFSSILENPHQDKVHLADSSRIFEHGIFPTVQLNESTSIQIPLKIFIPTVAGTFSVLLFFHGTCLENSFYTSIFHFIASHGYIVVAPQLYSCSIFGGTIPFFFPISGQEEVEIGAKVANWLPQSLQSVLPANVKANLNKLALGGHSRGGKAAFAIALGKAETALTVKFSALIGLDPVAGTSKDQRTEPHVLTYVPGSFDLPIPVTVIGTGLGNQTACGFFCPACAPNDVNHVEFYNECKAPVAHFVATDYGHMDILDDNLSDLMGFIAERMCKNSGDPKDLVRRTVGGIVVSFLKAYFHGNSKDFNTILSAPSVAPAALNQPQFKPAQSYAQI